MIAEDQVQQIELLTSTEDDHGAVIVEMDEPMILQPLRPSSELQFHTGNNWYSLSYGFFIISILFVGWIHTGTIVNQVLGPFHFKFCMYR